MVPANVAVPGSLGSGWNIDVCVQVSRRFAVWSLLFIVKVRRSCIQHNYSSSPPPTTPPHPTPQLGTRANSKRLCLSTAIPKNGVNGICANAAVSGINGKSPRITADLRATIKHQDFPVTGPQSSAQHQKKKEKVPRSQTGRQVKWQRSAKKVTSGRPAAAPRAYASRKGLNTAPWICEFCVKCLTTKGPPHQFWWRRSTCICTRVDHFFSHPTNREKCQKQLISCSKRTYTTER